MKNLVALSVVALVACAHAPQPIVVTGEVLDGAGITFEAVAAGMQSASDAHALTVAQVEAWNDFLGRWQVGYRKAVDDWKAARANLDESAIEQASAALGRLLGELSTWQFVVAGIKRPSARELSRCDDDLMLAGGAPWKW